MTKRAYRNAPHPFKTPNGAELIISYTPRGSRIRPNLFTSPRHFAEHGEPLSADELAKVAKRYGVRVGKSNLRRGERAA